jgi:hypothetical protein
MGDGDKDAVLIRDPKTPAEKVYNWLRVLALASALGLGGYASIFKGEPDAALSYKKLAEEFNILKTEVAKERAFLDGFLSGSHQGYSFGVPVGGEVPATQPALPKKTLKGSDTKTAPLAKAVPPVKAPSKVSLPPATAPAVKAPAPVMKAPAAPRSPWQQQRLERAPLRDLPTDIETLKRNKR